MRIDCKFSISSAHIAEVLTPNANARTMTKSIATPPGLLRDAATPEEQVIWCAQQIVEQRWFQFSTAPGIIELKLAVENLEQKESK